MGFLEVIFEIVLPILDALLTSADLVAWIKGKENRVERKEARKTGTDLPPRDPWNRLVVILSVLVGAITIGLLLWRWR